MEFGTARYYNSSEFFNESSWWYDESLTHVANGATEIKDKFVTSTHSGMEIGKEDGNSDVPYSCGSPLCCELLGVNYSTGFEENKDFPIVLSSVIAGKYYVSKYHGSTAFSKVVQSQDLQMVMDVCLKIIKK